ncbi:MAG: hypothetical protein L6R48_17835, partial [Planctomycetes bacterium]|nr:hypothetical protein [Planctomycetota bacterium]
AFPTIQGYAHTYPWPKYAINPLWLMLEPLHIADGVVSLGIDFVILPVDLTWYAASHGDGPNPLVPQIHPPNSIYVSTPTPLPPREEDLVDKVIFMGEGIYFYHEGNPWARNQLSINVTAAVIDRGTHEIIREYPYRRNIEMEGWAQYLLTQPMDVKQRNFAVLSHDILRGTVDYCNIEVLPPEDGRTVLPRGIIGQRVRIALSGRYSLYENGMWLQEWQGTIVEGTGKQYYHQYSPLRSRDERFITFPGSIDPSNLDSMISKYFPPLPPPFPDPPQSLLGPDALAMIRDVQYTSPSNPSLITPDILSAVAASRRPPPPATGPLHPTKPLMASKAAETWYEEHQVPQELRARYPLGGRLVVDHVAYNDRDGADIGFVDSDTGPMALSVPVRLPYFQKLAPAGASSNASMK